MQWNRELTSSSESSSSSTSSTTFFFLCRRFLQTRFKSDSTSVTEPIKSYPDDFFGVFGLNSSSLLPEASTSASELATDPSESSETGLDES